MILIDSCYGTWTRDVVMSAALLYVDTHSYVQRIVEGAAHAMVTEVFLLVLIFIGTLGGHSGSLCVALQDHLKLLESVNCHTLLMQRCSAQCDR